MRLATCLLAAALWAIPAAAYALPDSPLAPAPSPPSGLEVPDSTHTSVGGQLFADYALPLGSFAPQAFEVKRARLYGNVAINPTWSGSIVTNVRGVSADVGGKPSNLEALNVYLEMGYLQATNLWPGSRLQAGAIITPWFEYEARAYGYRMLGYLPDAGGLSIDRHGVQIVPFYDLGISLQGSYLLGGMPLGYAVAVLNGESNRTNELDGQKDLEARLTVKPRPDVELTVMGHKRNPSGVFSGDLVNREMLLALYERAGYKVALEANLAQDPNSTGGEATGTILGGWVVVPVPNRLVPAEVVVRGDRITGDRLSLDPAAGYRFESVVGLAITPANLVRIVLDNQLVNAFPATGAPWVEDTVAVHTELKY